VSGSLAAAVAWLCFLRLLCLEAFALFVATSAGPATAVATSTPGHFGFFCRTAKGLGPFVFFRLNFFQPSSFGRSSCKSLRTSAQIEPRKKCKQNIGQLCRARRLTGFTPPTYSVQPAHINTPYCTGPWAAAPAVVPILKLCYWLSDMQVIFDNREV
jgi:hypothetical protein